MNVREFVEQVISELVDQPDKLVVKEIEGDKATVLEVEVASKDTAHVIGRQGRVINSMRDVVRAMSRKTRKKYMIEVI